MLKGRKGYILMIGLILSLGIFGLSHMDARASSRKEYLDSLNTGIAQIVDPTAGASNEKAIEELTQMSEASSLKKSEESDLVMVNVQVAMNVRAEATEDSEKVGVLYKDCGGRILEIGRAHV